MVLGADQVKDVGLIYSEDDGRLLRELGRYINVHLQICWVVAKVRDTSESAIDSRDCSAETDEEGGGKAHFGKRLALRVLHANGTQHCILILLTAKWQDVAHV